MVDHEGNTVVVGTKLFIPVQVTAITSFGNLVVSTGYANKELIVVGTDTHSGGTNNWPAMPA